MPQYTPPLRDMQFVMHELLNAADELKRMPRHKDIDADTMNSVLEEGGKFAAGVIAPLNVSCFLPSLAISAFFSSTTTSSPLVMTPILSAISSASSM